MQFDVLNKNSIESSSLKIVHVCTGRDRHELTPESIPKPIFVKKIFPDQAKKLAKDIWEYLDFLDFKKKFAQISLPTSSPFLSRISHVVNNL